MSSEPLNLMARTIGFIGTKALIAELVDHLLDLPCKPASLYFSLEGNKLSREGSISILQLLVVPRSRYYLIDVVLGEAAFTTAGTRGKTLKDIFESSTIPKICFDVRNDSNVLYFHYGISLNCIEDLQLMEKASRPPVVSKKHLHNLERCIDEDAPITPRQKSNWLAAKKRGEFLFEPENNSKRMQYNSRPLRSEVMVCCVQDVQFLPLLRQIYWDRLKPNLRGKLKRETKFRVQWSQKESYKTQEGSKEVTPW